ncbi:MAG TPA: hypothetical protein VF974_01260, partial [Patescibacteria group bacterium]
CQEGKEDQEFSFHCMSFEINNYIPKLFHCAGSINLYRVSGWFDLGSERKPPYIRRIFLSL